MKNVLQDRIDTMGGVMLDIRTRLGREVFHQVRGTSAPVIYQHIGFDERLSKTSLMHIQYFYKYPETHLN